MQSSIHDRIVAASSALLFAVSFSAFASAESPSVVRGRVVDANGKPAANVRVLAAESAVATIFCSSPEGAFATSPSESDAALGTVGHLTGKAQSGASGSFEIGDLRRAKFTIFAIRADGASGARFDVDAGSGSAEVELALAPPSSVEGALKGFAYDGQRHVLELKPVAPTHNIAFTPNVQFLDGDRFRFAALPSFAGTWRISLTDWVRSRAFRATLFEQAFELAAGSAQTFDLDFARGESISGRVVDAKGAPLADTSVLARSNADPRLVRGTVTDERGRFTVRGLAPGEFTLDARRWTMRPTAGCGVGPRDTKVETKVTVVSADVENVELRADRALSAPNLGDLAPDFEVETLDGRRLTLASLRGKVVLIDFWATWCGLCRAEFPRLRETYRMFGGGTDFEIVGVSVDDESTAPKRVAEGLKLPWPQTALGSAERNALAQLYDVASTPSSFLIDREGRIVAEHLQGDELRAAIAKLLGPRVSK